MNYAKINTHDVANGPGVRVSLFVSGCEHRCPGCFNPETWDFDYGQELRTEDVLHIMRAGEPDYIAGLTVLGGEPLHPQNCEKVTAVVYIWANEHPDKPIWLYTGYRYEDIHHLYLMKYVDVLVDGPFVEAEKDLNLRFRGSRNQRIIDVKKSREARKVVLWNEEER